MIPEFPTFKKLELSDREEVMAHTSSFAAYSDFNFTSMWCWTGEKEIELSKFENNLIVKFCDYIYGKEFYSYLGRNNVSELSKRLIEYSHSKGLEPILKLVPEESIIGLDAEVFKIEESQDNFDYILDTQALIDLKGRKLHNHAGFKRRFSEAHGNLIQSKIFNSCGSESLNELTLLAELWIKNKIRENKEVAPEPEVKALKRVCELEGLADRFRILTIFHDNKIIAFTIDELLMGEYAIRHFMKADTSYKGVYSYLVSESAKMLLENGIKYLNIEQDLGLKNLRQAKNSYRPAAFFKKYTVSLI
jgi:uncharacterized protein